MIVMLPGCLVTICWSSTPPSCPMASCRSVPTFSTTTFAVRPRLPALSTLLTLVARTTLLTSLPRIVHPRSGSLFSSLGFSGDLMLRTLMAPLMVATLSRGVTFGRLLRPHPRVLGASVCASTRCFLAGLSSRFSRVAIIATSSLFKNNCSSLLSSLSCPIDSFNY